MNEMEIIYLVGLTILLGGLIFVLIKNKKLKSELEKTKSESEKSITSLNNKLNSTVDLLSNRNGFYVGSTTLVSEEDKKNGVAGEKYTYLIYVKELDRYTNGMSKIEFSSIEVTSGYHQNQYSWVKELETGRFASLKKNR